MMSKSKPLNLKASPHLYVHFPVCKHHCSYCDFNLKSEIWVNQEWGGGFTRLWLERIDQQLGSLETPPKFNLKTLYLGGGTPSLLDLESLATLFDNLKRYFVFDRDIEITLEANPENINHHYLSEIKRLGVNRLSLGIQTTIASQLKRLERLATFDHILNAVGAVKDVFENYSFDLMIGIPEQSILSLEEDLNFIESAKPPHLSVYLLTISDDHKWKKSKHIFPKLATSETAAQFYKKICERLSEWNYEHYEVSNFARKGFKSQHNSNYWNVQSSYLGLGPGAHGYLVNKLGERYRYESERDLKEWLKQDSPFQSGEILSAEQQRLERLYLSLRTRKPVPISELNATAVSEFKSENLLTVTNQSVILTDSGWVLMESLADRLIP